MLLTPFEDNLSLFKPSVVDQEKVDITDEVSALKTQLDMMMWAVPNNKEQLCKEQVTGCMQWQALLVNHNCLISNSGINNGGRSEYTLHFFRCKGLTLTLNWAKNSWPICEVQISISKGGKVKLWHTRRQRRLGDWQPTSSLPPASLLGWGTPSIRYVQWDIWIWVCALLWYKA